MEVKHKKSTNAHRGIITRNVFKLKTLLTRKKKKLYGEKFKLFSVFSSEIFPYRVDISTVKRKIKAEDQSSGSFQKAAGFTAPDIHHRKRMEEAVATGGPGPEVPVNTQAPQHCPLASPSHKGLKIHVKLSPLLHENEHFSTTGLDRPTLGERAFKL